MSVSRAAILSSQRSWTTAVPDWEDRIMAGRPLVPNLPLFKDEAALALRIFKRLRLPDVVGTPTMGEASGEWFFQIVEAIFGSLDPETNIRAIQEVFLLVPKKNGKSSYAAAIMVVAAIVNKRPEAEFMLVAPTMEIANIAFRQASGIIKLDTELSKIFQVQRHVRTITHRETGATIQIKAADTDVITGSKSTGILVDETHVFAKKGNAADLFVEIRGSLAARPDGFLIQITTQSKEPPSGVFKSELNIARDVRDGKLTLPRLAILYELPDGMAKNGGWKAPATWPLVNPNLGRSVRPEFLRNEMITAEEGGAPQLALFASQHFNVEIGQGLRTDSWAGAEFWEAAGRSDLTLESLLARCEVVVVGIDGGGLDDLLGLAILGRERGTGNWLLWSHAWAHRIVLERRKSEASKLLDFERDGDLTIVDLPGYDVADVADLVMMVENKGLLAKIGVDAIGIGAIVDELVHRGIDESRIVGIRQGFGLQGSVKDCERALAGGMLLHGARPMMAWCVGNARVEPRGNAILISKQVSGSAKIDPLAALFDATALMGKHPAVESTRLLENAILLRGGFA